MVLIKIKIFFRFLKNDCYTILFIKTFLIIITKIIRSSKIDLFKQLKNTEFFSHNFFKFSMFSVTFTCLLQTSYYPLKITI